MDCVGAHVTLQRVPWWGPRWSWLRWGTKPYPVQRLPASGSASGLSEVTGIAAAEAGLRLAGWCSVGATEGTISVLVAAAF